MDIADPQKFLLRIESNGSYIRDWPELIILGQRQLDLLYLILLGEYVSYTNGILCANEILEGI